MDSKEPAKIWQNGPINGQNAQHTLPMLDPFESHMLLPFFEAGKKKLAGVACSRRDTRDNLSESRFRAVQFYDDRTNDCGSGADM